VLEHISDRKTTQCGRKRRKGIILTAVTHHDSFVDHVADVSDENAQEGQKEPFFCKMSEENLPQVGDGFDEPC
jgi:hypothetical protein